MSTTLIDPNERLNKDHPANGNALLRIQAHQKTLRIIHDKPLQQWQLDNIDIRHDDDCPALRDGICTCTPDLYIPNREGGKDKY